MNKKNIEVTEKFLIMNIVEIAENAEISDNNKSRLIRIFIRYLNAIQPLLKYRELNNIDLIYYYFSTKLFRSRLKWLKLENEIIERITGENNE
jgi:hypothetical protein